MPYSRPLVVPLPLNTAIASCTPCSPCDPPGDPGQTPYTLAICVDNLQPFVQGTGICFVGHPFY